MEVREGCNVVGESSIGRGRGGCIGEYTSGSHCQRLPNRRRSSTRTGQVEDIRRLEVLDNDCLRCIRTLETLKKVSLGVKGWIFRP